MKNANSIKLRIKSVQQAMQVTNAMDVISVAKRRKAIQAQKANEVYFERIVQTVKDVVKYTVDYDNVFINQAKQGKSAYIVIASDKGLCGAYNSTILKWADKHFSSLPKDSFKIFFVGQMVQNYFSKKGYDCDDSFLYNSEIGTQKDAIKIANAINELYLSKEINQVNIIYSAMQSSSSSKPKLLEVLPIKVDTKEQSIDDQEFFKELVYEPSVDEVMRGIVEQYLVGTIYGALVNCANAEHTSRSMSMSNAARRSKEALEDLTIEYNFARQEQIIRELIANKEDGE